MYYAFFFFSDNQVKTTFVQNLHLFSWGMIFLFMSNKYNSQCMTSVVIHCTVILLKMIKFSGAAGKLEWFWRGQERSSHFQLQCSSPEGPDALLLKLVKTARVRFDLNQKKIWSYLYRNRSFYCDPWKPSLDLWIRLQVFLPLKAGQIGYCSVCVGSDAFVFCNLTLMIKFVLTRSGGTF